MAQLAKLDVPDELPEAAQDATLTGVEHLARFGYVVRGLLYAVVGFLAIQVALGTGGETTDTQGAVTTLGAQAPGRIVLVLIALGLAGYALWGYVRAIFDPLDRGTSAKGLVERFGYLVSAISYSTLLVATVQIIFGAGDDNEGEVVDFTAGVLTLSFGPWLVAAAGTIVIAGGLGEWYRAISAGFKKDFKQEQMSEIELGLATAIGRLGHAARGVVFMMIGYFLFKAGVMDNAYQAKGLDGALMTLAQQSYGPVLLGVVALGLLSFGVFSMLYARWLRAGIANTPENNVTNAATSAG